jgi:hypothetical protein
MVVVGFKQYISASIAPLVFDEETFVTSDVHNCRRILYSSFFEKRDYRGLLAVQQYGSLKYLHTGQTYSIAFEKETLRLELATTRTII